MRIELTNGGFTEIDDSDYAKVSKYTWWRVPSKHSDYAYAWINGTNTPMHGYILGEIGAGLVVDHRDNNGLNNKRSNLRTATKSQNAANRTTAKNKYLGVCRQKFKAKGKEYEYWIAKAYKDGKGYRVRCDNEVQAARTYNTIAMILHGEFAKLNVIH